MRKVNTPFLIYNIFFWSRPAGVHTRRLYYSSYK
nr:MAG TPA: hypothetical protein [Caudoviricetes sp.]